MSVTSKPSPRNDACELTPAHELASLSCLPERLILAWSTQAGMVVRRDAANTIIPRRPPATRPPSQRENESGPAATRRPPKYERQTQTPACDSEPVRAAARDGGRPHILCSVAIQSFDRSVSGQSAARSASCRSPAGLNLISASVSVSVS